MDSPTPGIYHITNNQTGLYLDLFGSQPTGNVINWPLNNPPSGNQQWNLTWFNSAIGGSSGYILTAVAPKSHIWGSDNAGAALKGDPAIQKVFYIFPANNHSTQYIFTTQNKCDCDEGLVWEGHAQGAAVTLETANVSHPAQYWNLARLN